MTAQAPPTKARKATRPRKLTLTEAKEAELTRLAEAKKAAEGELVRWTPEEVVEKRLLPYTSARVLKEKCYRRKVYHHNDGGRITFTVEDIRRENERNTVAPFAAEPAAA